MFEDTETVNEPSETTNMDSAQFFSHVIYSITRKQHSIEPSWFVVQSVSEPTLSNPSNKVDQVAAKNATSAFNVRTRTVVAYIPGIKTKGTL